MAKFEGNAGAGMCLAIIVGIIALIILIVMREDGNRSGKDPTLEHPGRPSQTFKVNQ